QHYMLGYRVVMDPSMLANAMQTDAHEVRDLLSWRLAFNPLWVISLPAWALWHAHVLPMRFASQAWRNALLFVAALAVAAGGILATSRLFAPLMRNNVHLRYMINPLATIYSAASVTLKPMFR